MPLVTRLSGRAADFVRRIRNGETQVVWAIADQGAVSVGNFTTNILVARTVTQQDFGAYALLLALMIAFNMIHGALITYPLLVHGARAKASELPAALAASLALTVVLWVPMAAATCVAAFAIHRSDLAPWAAAGLGMWQVQETCRRALLSRLRNRDAVVGDSISYVGQAALAKCLLPSHPAVDTVFGCMILTSAVAATVQCAQVRLDWRLGRVREVVVQYWHLGRLYLSGTCLTIVSAQALPWVLGLSHGAHSAAAFQGATALLAATHPVIFSISNLIMPATASESAQAPEHAHRPMLSYGLQGGLLLFPYLAVLFAWPRAVLGLVFGSASPYLTLTTPLRICVLAYAIGYVASVFSAYVAGIGNTRVWWHAELAAAAASVIFGWPLIIKLGVAGATLAIGIASAARLARFAWYSARGFRWGAVRDQEFSLVYKH